MPALHPRLPGVIILPGGDRDVEGKRRAAAKVRHGPDRPAAKCYNRVRPHAHGPGSWTREEQALRMAVVGHVEWVTFLRLPRLPSPGAILRATEAWEEPAGGGGVAAVELARLGGSCSFFTALGDDTVGRQSRRLLAGRGVVVHAALRALPTRRATTLLGPDGDRSILIHGPALAPAASDPLPYGELAGADAVYLCKGDPELVRQARRARVLVATARLLPVLQQAGVELDVLVRSGHDEGEQYRPGDLTPAPRLEVCTEGDAGGCWRTARGEHGRYRAQPLPGPRQDTYGAGDCFAASLAFALAAGRQTTEALEFAALRGALALTRAGAHGELADLPPPPPRG